MNRNTEHVLRVFPRSRAPIDARLLVVNPSWSCRSVVVTMYPPYFISIRRTGRLNALNVIPRYSFTKRRIISEFYIHLGYPEFETCHACFLIFVDPSRGLRLLRVLWNHRKIPRIFERNGRAAVDSESTIIIISSARI